MNRMSYLFIFVFFFASLYNLSHYTRIKVKVYKSVQTKLIFILGVSIFFWMAYIMKNDWVAYLLALSASLFFVSGEYGKGISEKAIYTKSGKFTVIPIAFEQLEKIRFVEQENVFLFKANGRKMQIREKFDLHKMDEVKAYLSKYQ